MEGRKERGRKRDGGRMEEETERRKRRQSEGREKEKAVTTNQ